MAVWLPRFRLDCRKCTLLQKRSRGCEAEAEQPFFIEVNGEKEVLKNCPIRLVAPLTVRIMQLYRFYKQGFLPNTGGILQQSSVLLTAFDVIENEVERIREKEDAGSH